MQFPLKKYTEHLLYLLKWWSDAFCLFSLNTSYIVLDWTLIGPIKGTDPQFILHIKTKKSKNLHVDQNNIFWWSTDKNKCMKVILNVFLRAQYS